MNKIELAEKVFTDAERWKSFLELSKLTNDLKRHWLAIGAREVETQWLQSGPSDWRVENWGNDVDLKWILKGDKETTQPVSFEFGFGWEYEFHLILPQQERYDSAVVEKAVKASPTINELFPEPGRGRDGSIRQRPRPFFSVDGSETNQPLEYCWLAGCSSEDFAKQVVTTIQDLISQSEFSDEINKLNEDLSAALLKD